MRVTIEIPENVRLKNPDGSDSDIVLRFVDWIANNRLLDEWLGKSVSKLFAGMDMRRSIENLSAGDEWEITGFEYDILKQVVNNPSDTYRPFVAYQIKSFFDAVNKPVNEPSMEQPYG